MILYEGGEGARQVDMGVGVGREHYYRWMNQPLQGLADGSVTGGFREQQRDQSGWHGM